MMDVNLLSNYYLQEQQQRLCNEYMYHQQRGQWNQSPAKGRTYQTNTNSQMNQGQPQLSNLQHSQSYQNASTNPHQNQRNQRNQQNNRNNNVNNSNSNNNINNNNNQNNQNNNYIQNYQNTKQTNNQTKYAYEDNDYSNNYIHTGNVPVNYVRNIENPVEGYPKLRKLVDLKETHIRNFTTKPYGCRVQPEKIVSTLNNWIVEDNLQFDVIMIGALVENQFIQPLLTQLPIHRLCAKPGYLFIWATTQKIQELTKLLGSDGWGKKFRRSEELVFVPINKDSPYHPNKDSDDDDSLFERMQWHCWMCITGTVRRSTDGHLIHCNIDTDLHIQNDKAPACVPSHLYTVAENFSSSTRRLHIIPSRTGFNHPVKLRPGWVIMSPDIMLDNFDPKKYKQDISIIGNNVPENQEIDELRPKSPTPK